MQPVDRLPQRVDDENVERGACFGGGGSVARRLDDGESTMELREQFCTVLRVDGKNRLRATGRGTAFSGLPSVARE
jgi:hypothetical protein